MRLCYHRGRCRRLCSIVLLILVVLILYVVYHVRQHQCSPQESQHLIQELCSRYHSEEVTGNLCAPICTHKSIVFHDCMNYRGGKIIMLCHTHNTPVILKTFQSTHHQELFSHVELSQFYALVSNTLHFHFSVNLSEYAQLYSINNEADIGASFVTDMWMGEQIQQDSNAVVLQSVWDILQQEEYITMKTFQDNAHIPRILGSCAGFYAMEYSPPGSLLGQRLPFTNFQATTWTERANIALGLLDLVESFSNLGPPHKELHLCDMKGENFGVGVDGVIKAIDVDMAFVSSKLSDELRPSNCSSHRDCDFFDCWGWCVQGRCTGIRRNNNLQALCSKVFLSHGGLIASPPAAYSSTLWSILDQCVHPSLDPRTQYATTHILHQLRDTLKQSIQ